MALAVKLRFKFVDDSGKTSNTTINVPTGFTIADYQAGCAAFAQLLIDVSDARLTGAGFGVGIDLSALGLNQTANVLSKVGRKMTLLFNTVTTGLFGKAFIPTLDETLVPQGSDAVDQSLPAVAALISAVETGVTTPGGQMTPTNGRGLDAVDVTQTVESFTDR